MSQTTKTAQIPAFGPRWVTARTIALITGALAVLVLATAIAVSMLSGTPTTISSAAVVPDVSSLSRLDDYGLRHPKPFGAATTDSRLDDYGLRHPNPFGAATTDSRLDDYGLRHPNPFGAATTDSRLNDYGLRHPKPFGAATTDSRLDDYGLRHPKP
jgi:hypothetical protein